MPKIESRIQAPRKTALVRYGCDDTASTAGMLNNPPRCEPSGKRIHSGFFEVFCSGSTAKCFAKVAVRIVCSESRKSSRERFSRKTY